MRPSFRAGQAQAGQFEQAEAIARSINDPYGQAEALTQLAETLARAKAIPFACRISATACAVGHWTTAAKPLLILAPSAFATIEPLLVSN